jgi:DNA-binding response OmpR family regulator/DNA-binding CsgD family transcriptional regulator
MEKRKTVLIIDDDPESRSIAITYLSNNSENYNIYSAPDGIAGIEIAIEEKPDLVLLDWQMPLMDGIEVLKDFKSNETIKDIPVIMYTGIMTDSASLRQALELGAYDFLRKPVQPIELEARIKAAIVLIEKNKEKLEAEQKVVQLEKEQLKYELINKNKEVTDYAMFLASKNESLLYLIDKLQHYIDTESLNQTQYSYIRSLILEINSKIEAHQNFEKFTEMFKQLHPSFSEKIAQHAADLSKNEITLLTFIKLNFSNKEISSLLNVTTAAVEKSKYRLKTKLNLGNNVNLQQFVLNM